MRSSNDKTTSCEDDQPYLQQKGELKTEERRIYELHANQRQHELEGNDEISEMPASTNPLVHPHRPELSGGEHCKELRAGEVSKEMD